MLHRKSQGHTPSNPAAVAKVLPFSNTTKGNIFVRVAEPDFAERSGLLWLFKGKELGNVEKMLLLKEK